jgi:hypothetical protein
LSAADAADNSRGCVLFVAVVVGTLVTMRSIRGG